MIVDELLVKLQGNNFFTVSLVDQLQKSHFGYIFQVRYDYFGFLFDKLALFSNWYLYYCSWSGYSFYLFKEKLAFLRNVLMDSNSFLRCGSADRYNF